MARRTPFLEVARDWTRAGNCVDVIALLRRTELFAGDSSRELAAIAGVMETVGAKEKAERLRKRPLSAF